VNIEKCRVCFSSKLTPILDLGNQPWCNDYQKRNGKECAQYPLATVFCEDCSTFQVSYTVPKEIMYNHHTYLSGANASMPAHFLSIAEKCVQSFNPDAKFVVDIGSNDGTLLSQFKKLGLKVLGVEPCSEASKVAIESGILTKNDFFDRSQADDIRNEFGNADIVSAANVFYHVEKLHDIVTGVKSLLAERGTFIIQGTYLPELIENNEFDIIYHEHLLYYRVENLNFLLRKHGLEIFDVQFSDVHGGSFIAYACHEGSRTVLDSVAESLAYERSLGYHTNVPYFAFRDRVVNLRSEIKSIIADLKNQGKEIYAYGAPCKGTVMINYCNLDSDSISCAVEVNESKIGTYVPGTSIEVIDEKMAKEPDYYFLLSWNFLSTFKKHEMFINGHRKFLVPIPSPKMVSNDSDKN
jgi:SAM-dependent methyltransferase